jgi:FkbM family methyltransferase
MNAVLGDLTALKARIGNVAGGGVWPQTALPEADVLVVPCEVNPRHGTGVLLQRIFGGSPDLCVVWSVCNYGQENYLGDMALQLAHKGCPRPSVYGNVVWTLRNTRVRRVLCVPFYADDCWNAIALHDLFGAPLCTYVMDDHNIHSSGIGDDLLSELIAKSDLCLAISPELRNAYEMKFRTKFHVVPPVVDPRLIHDGPALTPGRMFPPRTGVLVGNIWNPHWLTRLRAAVRGAGLTLHWYTNALSATGGCGREELERDGIVPCGSRPEGELADLLKRYYFAVVPSGCLDESDVTLSIARLSLPSRMPFILAGSHTPQIVVGHSETAAARFVQRLGVGERVDYDATELAACVDRCVTAEAQERMRGNAAGAAAQFSSEGLADWIWSSLERHDAVDRRFEALERRGTDEFAVFHDAAVPGHVPTDFAGLYRSLRRLKRLGFRADFVIDVGASSGIWSHTVNDLFPDARFLLFDPLMAQYGDNARRWCVDPHPNFETFQVAVSDEPGRAQFQVCGDLYGSSLLQPDDFRSYESIEVEVVTLDRMRERCGLTGRGLLKIDVQYAEHLVLKGASQLLEQIDLLVLELSLYRMDPRAQTFAEMLRLLESLGFDYFDDLGTWRNPVDGRLMEKDVLFIRRGYFAGPAGRNG